MRVISNSVAGVEQLGARDVLGAVLRGGGHGHDDHAVQCRRFVVDLAFVDPLLERGRLDQRVGVLVVVMDAVGSG
jgi:hypothetical protein